MAKFDATQAVDPLEFTFKPYVDFEGVIPEPTTDQVEAFQNAFLDAAKKVGIQPGQQLTPEMAGQLDESEAGVMLATVKAAITNVTGGLITEEHLKQLPFRIMTAFVAWLAGEFTPEAPAPGSRR